jgi:hypothetical protein
MPNQPTFGQLKAMTDEELRTIYHELADRTVVGTQFYLDELSRREALRIERSALDVAQRSHRVTETMRTLTWVILGATLVNVVLVAVTLWTAG